MGTDAPVSRRWARTRFDSQTAYVLPVKGSAGTTYVYMGDRWNPKDFPGSGYVWLPVKISGGDASHGVGGRVDGRPQDGHVGGRAIAYCVGWATDRMRMARSRFMYMIRARMS